MVATRWWAAVPILLAGCASSTSVASGGPPDFPSTITVSPVPATSGAPIRAVGSCTGMEVVAETGTSRQVIQALPAPNPVTVALGAVLTFTATGPCHTYVSIVPQGGPLILDTLAGTPSATKTVASFTALATGSEQLAVALEIPCTSGPCNLARPVVGDITATVTAAHSPASSPPGSTPNEAAVAVCESTLAAALSASPSAGGTVASFAPGSPVGGELCLYDLAMPADFSSGKLSRQVVLTATALRLITMDVQSLTPSDELASCPPPEIVEVVNLMYGDTSTTSLTISCSMVWQGQIHAMLTQPLADEAQALLAAAPSVATSS
jgi:hypothetical protein